MSRLHPRRSLPVLACLAACLAPVSALRAQDGSGAISLTISPSVRGEGMGGLYATLSRDYSTRWGNPGLLAFVDRSTVGIMYSKLVPDLADDVFYFYGGWVWPTSSVGTLQFDLTYLSYGESEATDSEGLPIGTFSSYEVAPAAGIGFKFLPNVGLGVTAKYVRVDLAPAEVLPDPTGTDGVGSSWAFDLGGIVDVNLKNLSPYLGNLRLGGVAANLGPNITFANSNQSDPMPRLMRLGGMYDALTNELGEVRVGAEWERSLVVGGDGPFDFSVWHIGGEFVYAGIFAVRAGYIADDQGNVGAATGGFGFTWANAGFEYANAPQSKELDRVHRFALWYRY